jgi:hypothetical protein
MRTKNIEKPDSPLPNPLEINHLSSVPAIWLLLSRRKKSIPATVFGYGFAGKCIVSIACGKCGVLTPCLKPLSPAA